MTATRHMDAQVGALVKALRIDRGMSQAGLARHVGSGGLSISQQTVHKIETGNRSVQLFEAAVIASVLNVDMSALLPDGAVPNLAALVAEERVAQAEADLARAQKVLRHYQGATT